jgi:hypothetical protein
MLKKIAIIVETKICPEFDFMKSLTLKVTILNCEKRICHKCCMAVMLEELLQSFIKTWFVPILVDEHGLNLHSAYHLDLVT